MQTVHNITTADIHLMLAACWLSLEPCNGISRVACALFIITARARLGTAAEPVRLDHPVDREVRHLGVGVRVGVVAVGVGVRVGFGFGFGIGFGFGLGLGLELGFSFGFG